MSAQEIIDKIKETNSEMDVCMSFDNEMLNWIDGDWKDDGEYDSEFDWYIDHNNGEAQDEVAKGLIEEIVPKLESEDTDLYCEVFDLVKEEYTALN